MSKEYSYSRIDDIAYQKAVGQYRLAAGRILKVFDRYGLGDYIPGAVQALTELTEQFGMRVRGKNQPIIPRNIREESDE